MFKVPNRLSFLYRIKKFRRNITDLPQCDANYTPLTPLTLLKHTVKHHPFKIAYVHGKLISRTWEDMFRRVLRFISVLQVLGIENGRDDVVSIIAPNTISIFEAHYAVPGAGAILHSINTRQDVKTIAFQLKHAKSKILIVDSEFSELIKRVMETYTDGEIKPIIIDSIDSEYQMIESIKDKKLLCGGGNLILEDLLQKDGSLAPVDEAIFKLPKDEWASISLNYTSGTTGDPKGVVCHHRGAYLNAINNVIEGNIERYSGYLWVVPMFHCNGWCFPWTVAATVSTSYFMRNVRADTIFDLIDRYKITFMSGAPVTMNTMLAYPDRFKFRHKVRIWVAGAPPPPPVIRQFEKETGVSVTAAYGLTEVYGPMALHLEHPISDSPKSPSENLHHKEDELGSQRTYLSAGVLSGEMTVRDPNTLVEIPSDGHTLGEVMIRGNIVMRGYLHNEKSTKNVFAGGWFHTGDLAVSHPNGRLEIKDRAKDIIISGGENISSIEVECTLLEHPLVLDVAVVAMEDNIWGEVPCAFIVKKSLVSVTTASDSDCLSEDIIKWCRTKLAGFKSPKKIIFCDTLPKTITGKIQKHLLRNMITAEN